MTIKKSQRLINLDEDGSLNMIMTDRSKPDDHIFVYKLSPLNSFFENNADDYVYLAIPNGRHISFGNVPKGCYILEEV